MNLHSAGCRMQA